MFTTMAFDKRKMEWMPCNGNDLDSYSPISLIIASVVATKNLQPKRQLVSPRKTR